MRRILDNEYLSVWVHLIGMPCFGDEDFLTMIKDGVEAFYDVLGSEIEVLEDDPLSSDHPIEEGALYE
jgi:hypothetical protein